MKRTSLALLLLVLVLTVACSAPPTPTPTPAPSPTATQRPPTAVPTKPPATLTPTVTPTQPTPTPAKPTETLRPPTRTVAPARTVVPPTATALKLPAPTGAIVYHSKREGTDQLYFVDPNTGMITPFVSGGGTTLDFTEGTNAHIGEFSPDGSRFAYIFAGSFGAANVLKVRDVASKIERAIYSSDTGGGLSSPTWSADGNRIAFIKMAKDKATFTINLVDADGKNAVELPKSDPSVQYRGGISWSKQNKLVFAQNIAGANSIYVKFPDTDKDIVTSLTKSDADNSTPVWCPDGSKIAFVSNRDGGVLQIYLMNANGSGLRRLSKSTVNDFSPTWSPDGNWIAFASTRGSQTDIYLMDTLGGNVKRLTQNTGDYPLWAR